MNWPTDGPTPAIFAISTKPWHGRPSNWPSGIDKTFPPCPRDGDWHAVRLALSGDAGSVSLLAWHLLAARVAGVGHQLDHTVPGQLLDDPYAAVRCVAERLLRAISNLVPPGYDYVVDSRFRPPARDQVWAAWQHDLRDIQAFKPLSQGILIRPDDLTAQRASFALWLRQRNDRPLRLRE